MAQAIWSANIFNPFKLGIWQSAHISRIADHLIKGDRCCWFVPDQCFTHYLMLQASNCYKLKWRTHQRTFWYLIPQTLSAPQASMLQWQERVWGGCQKHLVVMVRQLVSLPHSGNKPEGYNTKHWMQHNHVDSKLQMTRQHVISIASLSQEFHALHEGRNWLPD